jgi:hypothetical protein
MQKEFKTKDSGKREKFKTGAQRDRREGKGRYDLLSVTAIRRWSQLMERGAIKYEDNNWRKGMPLGRFLDSALRHLFQVLENDTSEDHAAAVIFNISSYMETRERIEKGELPKELDDVKHTEKNK